MITHPDEPAQGDEEIRPLLGERLGLPLSDDEFGFLLLQGTLGEIASVSDDKRRREAALRKAVETIRNLRAAQGMPVGEGPQEVGGMATGDRDRRYAVSRLLAIEAGRAAEVVAFRERYLGGGVLAWENLGAWIAGQAAAQGPPSQYVEIVLPPGTTLKATLAGPGRRELDCAGRGAHRRRPQRQTPEVRSPGGKWVQVAPVRAGSVLDELRRLSQRLANDYSWKEDQATVFVLSGVTPLVAGIRLETSVQTEHPAASRVTLVIDPLLSPQAVLETYSELRHKVLEGSYRPLREKHLRLAVFAAERRPPAKWAEVMRAWNQENAGQRYSKVTVFARDCAAAQRRLLRPRLNPDALI